jgi:acetyl-CoA acyltransferase
MQEAVIVSIARTAVGKAPRGTLRNTRPDEMAAVVIQEAIKRVPGLEANEVEDVILGCAMPEGEQGNNVARIASLRASLPVTCSALTINRFCSSGIYDKIAGGKTRKRPMHAAHELVVRCSRADRFPDG